LLKFAEAKVCDEDYFNALIECGQCQQQMNGAVRLALDRARWLHFADRPETDQWRFQARMVLGKSVDFLRVDDDEAAALLSKSVEVGRRVWGPIDEFTIRAEQSLAVHLSHKGRPEKERALVMLTRIYEQFDLSKGPDDLCTLTAAGSLVDVLCQLGNFVKEEELQRKRLAGWRRTKGENDMRTIQTRMQLVQCLRNQGKYDAARAEYVGLHPLAERVLGPEHRLVHILQKPEFRALAS